MLFGHKERRKTERRPVEARKLQVEWLPPRLMLSDITGGDPPPPPPPDPVPVVPSP